MTRNKLKKALNRSTGEMTCSPKDWETDVEDSCPLLEYSVKTTEPIEVGMTNNLAVKEAPEKAPDEDTDLECHAEEYGPKSDNDEDVSCVITE